MLADPAFLRWLAARSTAGTVEAADVLGSVDDGFVVTVRREIPAEQVIAQVWPLAGHAIEIRQTEAWEPTAHGRRRGTAVYEVAGFPVRATGTLVMTPVTGAGSRVGFTGSVTATVPVVAGALERALAQRIRGLLAETEAAGTAWLERD